MDRNTKEYIQNLVAMVESALARAYKDGMMSELEYRKADFERTNLYWVLDSIETAKNDRIRTLENIRDEVAKSEVATKVSVIAMLDREISEEVKREIERLA